jgi:hypothetical protein
VRRVILPLVRQFNDLAHDFGKQFSHTSEYIKLHPKNN